jgi:hypothetical protein
LWAPNQRDIPNYFKPRKKELPKSVVTAAAEYLAGLWNKTNTGTLPAQIPGYVKAETSNLSLAETFQAILFSLEY